MPKARIEVYLRNAGGSKYIYTVVSDTITGLTLKVREHTGQIMMSGFRHCTGQLLEWFGPHWIDKIKVTSDEEIFTTYPSTGSGT